MKQYYTVDEISELLSIHPKTIRRYIREGKLKANKVGKGWRVTGHDLSVFTEGDNHISKAKIKSSERNVYGKKKVTVSAVIDMEVDDMDEAIRIVNMVTALLNSKPREYGNTTMSSQFIDDEYKVRIMLWGHIDFIENIMSSIKVFTDQ